MGILLSLIARNRLPFAGDSDFLRRYQLVPGLTYDGGFGSDRKETVMDAAVLHALGRPPRCEQFSEPIARDGEAIVQVHAASLKPIDKQLASGSHYASPRELPVVCGSDGVGHLSDGQRVFFGGTRAPYGAMARRTVVRRAFCFPVPEGVDDETAAALPNPGVSAWLSLAFRARLTPGENVLILGATGVTGKLAVKIAKFSARLAWLLRDAINRS